MRRDNVQGITIPTVDVSDLGIAKPDRVPQRGLKHRLRIAWRTSDNLEYL